MAKFDILYHDMKPIEDEHDNICRSYAKHKCCICGDDTNYFEINYEAYVCSEECLKKMDEQYGKASRNYGQWQCSKCKCRIGEELYNANPGYRGNLFCPNCGTTLITYI